MKLVFYSPRFFPLLGGLEKVVRVWAEVLTTSGHDITIITETAANEPDDFPFVVKRNISFAKQLKYMRNANAVIQFNVSLKGLPVCLASRRPLIITHHTALFFPNGKTPWQQNVKRWVSNELAIGNISCSRYIASQFKSSAVVHSPYEAALFDNQHRRRKKDSFVYVGRLVSDKGVDLLLKAFAEVTSKFPGAELTIIGNGPDREMLQHLCRQMDIVNKVHFMGSVSGKNLVNILNDNEIMVVPSRMEPFGTTVLEGLACGCRMIVSNTGGLPDAAGGLSRLFQSDDVLALSKAMEDELLQPQQLDHDAVQRHLAAHTVDHTADLFFREIERLLAQ